MADGIEIEGMEDFEKMLQEMTLEDSKMKKAMKKAIEPVFEEVKNNAPMDKGGLKKGVKKSVKKDGMGVIGEVKLGAWYSHFNEFGTSYSKKNIGFFSRSIDSSKEQVLEILKQELLK